MREHINKLEDELQTSGSLWLCIRGRAHGEPHPPFAYLGACADRKPTIPTRAKISPATSTTSPWRRRVSASSRAESQIAWITAAHAARALRAWAAPHTGCSYSVDGLPLWYHQQAQLHHSRDSWHAWCKRAGTWLAHALNAAECISWILRSASSRRTS
jgi:hypothetical protein